MQAPLDVVAIRQVTGRCRIDSARRFRTVKPFYCAERCCPRGRRCRAYFRAVG